MASEKAIDRAVELIRKPGAGANYVYFFQRLDDPSWIGPLRERGFFHQPPERIAVEGGFTFPVWAEADYLLRVADRAPGEVADVLAAVELNDNHRVHAQLNRIAAHLGPAALLKWVKRELQWLKQQNALLLDLPDALEEVVLRLAHLGKTRRALEMAEELLRLTPMEGREPWQRRMQPRMEQWTYGKIATQLFPALQPVVGLDTVRLAANLLQTALDQTDESPRDMSDIWRPSIADSDENLDADAREVLIVALRDVALAEADDDSEAVAMVSSELLARPWDVFQRIGLYLLAQKAAINRGAAAGAALSEERLSNYALDREYAELIETVYPLLTSAERRRWLALVGRGPNWPPRRPEEREERKISEEDSERYASMWQRDRLALVSKHLPPGRKRQLRQLIGRFGPASSPAAPRARSWVGPTSPLSAEELAGMDASAIVKYLRTWAPSQDPMSPSREGLGRLLTGRIAADPGAFALVTSEIAGLESTYIRSALAGFQQAIKEHRGFDFEPVLALIEAAVENEDGSQGTVDETTAEDHEGHAAKGEAAYLIEEALTADVLPNDLENRVWPVLDRLSWDPEPSPEHEKRYGGTNMDPLTLSINTVRGRAMHAVIALAAWKKRHLGQDRKDSLADMPEIRASLDEHLNPDREPSETVRGVFGSRLAQLGWLDRDWLAGQLDALLPRDDVHSNLRMAAWDTYLSYGHLADSLFPLLQDHYEYAVKELPIPADRAKRAGKHPGFALGEHLALLYLRGVTALDDQQLIPEYFARASQEEAAHFVDFVGRAIQDASPNEIPEGMQQRLVALWDWLVANVRQEARAKTLAGFGWWYSSPLLDDDWSNKELVGLLRSHVAPDPGFTVFRKLGERTREDPKTGLEICRLYVAQSGRPWGVIEIRHELRRLLHEALRSSDSELVAAGRQLINTLGAMGMTEFRDLLDTSFSEAKDVSS